MNFFTVKNSHLLVLYLIGKVFYSNVGVTVTICFVFYIIAITQFILEF